MSRENLKSIIEEELKEVLGPQNALYVFDFDDTLVSDTATVYVENDAGRHALTSHEFHNYVLKEGESIDFSEFDEVTDPAVHRTILDKLIEHLDDSVILTARSRTEPIRDFLEGIGVFVPQIIAVGSREDEPDSVIINAKRKRDWIDEAIQSRGLDYVEFWDDNEHNIENVWSLQKKYPDVKIICHLVRHHQQA